MPIFSVFADSCSDISGSNLPPCSSPIGVVQMPEDVGLKPYGAVEGFQVSTLKDVILSFVNWFSWFIGLAAVVMGLYSGFLFITARDNANQLTTARQIMMYAIIGIGVAIIAFSLVSISKSLLGLL